MSSFVLDHFTIGDLHSFFSAFGTVAGHFKHFVQYDVGQDFKSILNNKKGDAIQPHKKDVVCWKKKIKTKAREESKINTKRYVSILCAFNHSTCKNRNTTPPNK